MKIIKGELSELSRCECNPNQDEPCVNDCLNRMMMIECHPAVCRAADKCCNQRFQKRQYPDMGPFKCGFGWGLRLNQDIEKVHFPIILPQQMHNKGMLMKYLVKCNAGEWLFILLFRAN